MVGDNVEQGIFPIEKALEISEQLGLDLVEISPNAVPPVCRVIDYNKFIYEQKKKLKEIKAKAAKTVIKEIRFGPNTDEHDFEFKLKHFKVFHLNPELTQRFIFVIAPRFIHSLEIIRSQIGSGMSHLTKNRNHIPDNIAIALNGLR